MRGFTIFALTLLSGLAAGPADAFSIITLPAPDTVPAAKLSGIKTIGLIYALDDQLEITHVGTTAFTNSRASLPIQDWSLEAVLTEEAAGAIAPRYSLTKADLDASAFRKAENRLFHPMQDQFKTLVTTAPGKTFDAYLLIKPFDSYQDPIGGTNQSLRGLGLYQHEFFDHKANAEYAMFSIFFLDGKTGEVLAANTMCFEKAGGKCTHRTVQMTDGSSWADRPDLLSDNQKIALQSDFKTFLSRGIKGELAEMGLVEPH